MDVCCINYNGKITVQIDNILQFAHVFKKLNVSSTKLTWNRQLMISFFTLKIIIDVYCISYMGKIPVQIDKTLQFSLVSKKLNVSPTKLTLNGQLKIYFFTLKNYNGCYCINYQKKSTLNSREAFRRNIILTLWDSNTHQWGKMFIQL